MDKKLWGYVRRFTLVHVMVYWIVGSVLYQIAGYEEAMATMEVFEHYRPLESFTMVVVVFLGQIIRGGILALVVYPFCQVFMKNRHGWLLLFGLLFGLKVLGSPIFISEFLAPVESMAEFLNSLKIGVLEIIAQVFVFSIIFFVWERKSGVVKVEFFPASYDQ
jgi:hypothetical protein